MLKSNILPYTGQTTYEFKINGISYKLPLVKVENGKYIVWLNTLGDVKLINLSAKSLANKLKGCDVLVTLESYGIEFAHSLATLLKHDKFVVCRTRKYSYMNKPLYEYWGPKDDIKSAVLYLDSEDAKFIGGKKVVIVDEIVGARRAMNAMEKLVEKAGGKVVNRVAIFSDEKRYPDILETGVLPVFKSKK